MKELGLRLNTEKSVLSPLQRTTYLGVVWDRPQCRHVFLLLGSSHPRNSQESESRLVTHCEAVSITAESDGSCIQRDTFWPAVHEIPTVVAQDQGGPVLGVPCHYVTLAMDVSLTGWGVIMNGHSVRGLWSDHHPAWYFSCLEMLAVFQVLKHFNPDLRGIKYKENPDSYGPGLLRTGPSGEEWGPPHSMVPVSPLCPLEISLPTLPALQGAAVSSEPTPQSLLPGNVAELESLPPLRGVRLSHPIRRSAPPFNGIFPTLAGPEQGLVMEQEVDTLEGTLEGHRGGPSSRQMVQMWPRLHLYAFPPIALLPGVLERVHQDGVRLLLVAPYWPARAWFSDLISLLDGSPWQIPVRRDLLSQAGGTILHPHPEFRKLAPSTRKLYTLKWRLFTSWCGHRQQDPVNCLVGTVLEFMQDRFSAGLAHCTLKVYVAALLAYHAPLGGSSVGSKPLVTCFLHGALKLRL
ncbi:Membrane protein insertase YidC [Labeo rohita]|uniref:Membrane protein insertase YidC n=1 Tax=Labeo rohita TaxID=84645 RepID=A0ABQ8L4V1_LABRO|nr:Membrane protein insertase YidC [Labeo rohita]